VDMCPLVSFFLARQCFLCCFLLRLDRGRLESISGCVQARRRALGAAYCVTLLFIFVTEIYPFLSPAVGGGSHVQVHLAASGDNVDLVKLTLPPDQSYDPIDTPVKQFLSSPVILLDQSDTAYFVLVPPTAAVTTTHAAQVQKSLVGGIIYLLPSPTPPPP